MSNPFDNENGKFLVLINSEGQHSLWPAFIDVPSGWDVALPAADKSACCAFIETGWTDMRPRSLIAAMGA
ncbi:MbtH family protein [Acidovorax sp. SUPP3334]|uniref:MbtH family protein n=1 Tax=Acidovorax sp. SUPP3334 TaxID=2920881 RepID=UPI0023DE1F9B|nr:MbtH family protein [Acidovorax sp. SUPP3334]GKT26451.1 MbtH family protein [Acidovorax sp. SUPP3334]